MSYYDSYYEDYNTNYSGGYSDEYDCHDTSAYEYDYFSESSDGSDDSEEDDDIIVYTDGFCFRRGPDGVSGLGVHFLTKGYSDMYIFTDPKYAINCITKWIDIWRTNGWRSVYGDIVANKDLIQSCVALVENRFADTYFEFARRHSGDYDNNVAHRLAVAGSKST